VKSRQLAGKEGAAGRYGEKVVVWWQVECVMAYAQRIAGETGRMRRQARVTRAAGGSREAPPPLVNER